MAWNDSSLAAAQRDAIISIAKQVVDSERPAPRYAVVATINRILRRATVIYVGESAAVTVGMAALQPLYVGQLVRVNGVTGDRYIEDVMGPAHYLPGFVPESVRPIRIMSTPSPPTVGTRVQVSGIASPQQFFFTAQTAQDGMNSSFLRTTVGGQWIHLGTTHPNQLYADQQSATTGGGSCYGRIEFITDSTVFEIMHKGASAYWRLWVDGQLVSATPVTVPNDGNLYWQPITFGFKAIRHIAIDHAFLKFGGIVVGATDSVFPATESRPKALVIGDSFVEGSGAAALQVDGFCANLSAHLGWDVWAGGQGGSGYHAPGSYTGKYSTRIGFYSSMKFDVIILSGGYNDATIGDSPSVQSEAEALIDIVRATWPNAAVVVTSPLINKGVEGWSYYLWFTHNALRTAAANKKVPFASVMEFPYDSEGLSQTGTLQANTSAAATTFTVNFLPPLRSTIEIGTGLTTVERRIVTAVSGASSPYTLTVAALTNAHNTPEVVKTVGGCLWTGTGRVGATTGTGNCDLYVSSDGVHPTPDGHAAIARALAEQIRLALTP